MVLYTVPYDTYTVNRSTCISFFFFENDSDPDLQVLAFVYVGN